MPFSVLQRKFDNLLTNNFVICMCRYFDTCNDNKFNRFNYVSYQSDTLHLQLNPIPHELFLIVIFMGGGGADAAPPPS